ncbi:NDKM protein, partial [Smithornis capensis]|nr:NDKM protein [Smithornis capensis]
AGPTAGPAMGFLGRCLARSLPRGQPGLSPPGPRCYGSVPPVLQEKTLVLAKPDALQRRLVGNIIQRFERRGFKLVAMKLLQVPVPAGNAAPRPAGGCREGNVGEGSVPVPQVWEGYNVVRCTRAMVGDTESVGTIRGDLSVHISRNVVHASDSVETAQREIGFWFQRNELVHWESRDRDHTYGS